MKSFKFSILRLHGWKNAETEMVYQLNVSICTYGRRSVVLWSQNAVIRTRFPVFPTLTILHMKEL